VLETSNRTNRCVFPSRISERGPYAEREDGVREAVDQCPARLMGSELGPEELAPHWGG